MREYERRVTNSLQAFHQNTVVLVMETNVMRTRAMCLVGRYYLKTKYLFYSKTNFEKEGKELKCIVVSFPWHSSTGYGI